MNITLLDSEHYALADFSFTRRARQRYVVFDVESTGADPSGDGVTQIGAVAVYDDGPRDAENFTSLVKPWKTIPEKIERLTGISNERVAAAGDFAAVWRSFAAFCGDAVLVTQCGYEFDYPILASDCVRCGLPPLSNEALDTKALFALLHPGRPEIFSTDFLAGHYGIDRSPFRRHDALDDALLISRIFSAQLNEMSSRGLRRLQTVYPVAIGRFVLPPI